MAKDEIPRAIRAMVPDEDADAVLIGLEREKAGVVARQTAVKAGRVDNRHPDDTAENLAERLKGVNAEIARVKKGGVTDREAAAQKILDAVNEAVAETRELAEASAES